MSSSKNVIKLLRWAWAILHNLLWLLLFTVIIILFYTYVPFKWVFCKVTHKEFQWPLEDDLGA